MLLGKNSQAGNLEFVFSHAAPRDLHMLARPRTPAQVSDCDRSPVSERGCRLPPTNTAADPQIAACAASSSSGVSRPLSAPLIAQRFRLWLLFQSLFSPQRAGPAAWRRSPRSPCLVAGQTDSSPSGATRRLYGESWGSARLALEATFMTPKQSAPGKLAKDRRCKSSTG